MPQAQVPRGSRGRQGFSSVPEALAAVREAALEAAAGMGLRDIAGEVEGVYRRALELFRRYRDVGDFGGEVRAKVARAGARVHEGPSLTGERVEPGYGDLHRASASAYRLKCTCPRAQLIASRAHAAFRRALEEAGAPGFPTAENLFRSYTLCKHAALALAYAAYLGEVDLESEEARETLAVACTALALASGQRVGAGAVLKAAYILARRHGGGAGACEA